MRKLEDVVGIEEFCLNRATLLAISRHEYTAQDLIIAARNGTLECLPEIGKTRAEKILEAVDDAGFILREPEYSRRIRRFLAKTYLFELGSTEEYEARCRITRAQRDDLLKLFCEELKPKEVQVLVARFGLKDDESPKTLEQIGRSYKVSRERIRTIEQSALRRLRRYEKRTKVQAIFPEIPWITVRQ